MSTSKEVLDKSCWTCLYHFDEPQNPILFGMCKYFEKIGKSAKEIPAKVADTGCDKWEQKIKQMEMKL